MQISSLSLCLSSMLLRKLSDQLFPNIFSLLSSRIRLGGFLCRQIFQSQRIFPFDKFFPSDSSLFEVTQSRISIEHRFFLAPFSPPLKSNPVSCCSSKNLKTWNIWKHLQRQKRMSWENNSSMYLIVYLVLFAVLLRSFT